MDSRWRDMQDDREGSPIVLCQGSIDGRKPGTGTLSPTLMGGPGEGIEKGAKEAEEAEGLGKGRGKGRQDERGNCHTGRLLAYKQVSFHNERSTASSFFLVERRPQMQASTYRVWQQFHG